MTRQPVHRRLLDRVLGRRVLRVGYRVAAVAAHAWWSLRGSRNRGCKCVLFHDGDVLLVRHTYGDRLAWDFPGGFVRRAEDPRAAAIRELGEELGVELAELEAVGSMIVETGRRCDTVSYFRGRLPDRRLTVDDVELAEVGWFDPRVLPRRLGDHVAAVLGPLIDRPPTSAAPSRTPAAGDPAPGSGQPGRSR